MNIGNGQTSHGWLEWQRSRLPSLVNKHKALAASEDDSVGTTTNIEVNRTARRFAGNTDKYIGEGQSNSSREMWRL